MKRVNTMELFNLCKEMNEKLDRIESKLDKLNGVAVKPVAPTKGKSKAKKSTTSSNNFDRSLYELKAKELGVWNTEYGKVTGTYVDGKKVADAKTNRAKVYAAMGIK